ncbi:hypothetical protein F4604DRAFT_1685868 [Suillus subluteus]|nr:hypothetical protein F4604DRAFT_1685868 [Suillus subluteus]
MEDLAFVLIDSLKISPIILKFCLATLRKYLSKALQFPFHHLELPFIFAIDANEERFILCNFINLPRCQHHMLVCNLMTCELGLVSLVQGWSHHLGEATLQLFFKLSDHINELLVSGKGVGLLSCKTLGYEVFNIVLMVFKEPEEPDLWLELQSVVSDGLKESREDRIVGLLNRAGDEDDAAEIKVEVDDRPPEFEGDFFGTYEEDEIQWPDDTEQYASSSESSDSSDFNDDIPGLNDAEWEPLITGRDLEDQRGAAEEDSTGMNSHDCGLHQQIEQHMLQEDGITIVQYPDGRAGQPVVMHGSNHREYTKVYLIVLL